MKKKYLLVLLISLAVIIGTIVLFSTKLQAPKNTIDTNTGYSQNEIAQHNRINDCWTIIGEEVYDITNYVPMHPGGEEILQTCGVDGTSMFADRVDSDGNPIGSGQPHSETAQKELAKFKIGVLNI